MNATGASKKHPARGPWKVRRVEYVHQETRIGGKPFLALGLSCGHLTQIRHMRRIGDRIRCYTCGHYETTPRERADE